MLTFLAITLLLEVTYDFSDSDIDLTVWWVDLRIIELSSFLIVAPNFPLYWKMPVR